MDGAITGKANARIKRNIPTGYMFYVNTAGVTFTLKNITITGELTSANPHPDGVKSIIRTSGVVVLDNGAVLKDNYVRSEDEPYGGAVRLYAGSTFTMNPGSLISGCKAEKSGSSKVFEGGAIMSGGTRCTVNINGGTIENCTAGNIGGAIALRSGTYTLNMTGGTIKGCSSVKGGGIYIAPIKQADNTYTGVRATVTLSGGKIESCTATDGGGIYLDCNSNASTLSLSGTEIVNCTATTQGGGIYTSRTTPGTNSTLTMTLTSGKIHGCRAEGPIANDNLGRGGAIAINSGVVANINGAGMEIYDNYAKCYGGGLQVSGSATILNFSNGYIGKEGHPNKVVSGAAGIHLTGSSTLNMSGGHLCYNESDDVGGGLHSSEGCTLNFTGGEIYNNVAKRQGGGINVNTRCNLEIPANSTLKMYGNKAGRGGAIMVDGAILTVRAGEFYENQALSSYVNNLTIKGVGGAFCLVTDNNSNTFASKCYLYKGVLNNNTASTHGGAIYIGETATDNLDLDPELHILGTEVTISNNNALNGNGGGVYMGSGTFNMTGGTFDGNTASQDGGGFYVTAPQGKTAQITISGGSITSNSATFGGGFFADGGVTGITKGNIQYNEASQDGGGIYANGGQVTVNYGATTDGKIHHNYAAQRGGGLFISGTGRLDLKGKTTLEYNRVPEGELGGGVYLEGTVQAGASSSDIIIVKDNYASNTETSAITASNRNNIYLPNPVDTQTTGVITVVNNGLNLSSSRIGFSVPHNFIPVIYCQTATYLQTTIMNSEAIFEDSERYSKYYSTTSPYKPNYIYLSADTWFAKVATQPDGFSLDNIDSPEDLAWLISMVNGRTTPAVSASNLSGTTITLTADLDMKAYSWIPIGYTGKSFNGTFNGNGHTISNLYCSYLGEGEGATGSGLGLFGTVENATIHDLFLNGVELQVRNQTGSAAYSMGAIANEAKGTTTIYNCTAESTMESTMSNTTMGGLVGKLISGTIHSSAAMPGMTGYTMGGLAGTNVGNIFNSFANPQFNYSGTANQSFVGGIVAENSGTVANCYVRFSRPQTSLGNAKFGQLAGSNSGSIASCYTPADFASNIPSAIVESEAGTTSSSTYSNVVAPYLYNRSNDNMVGSVTLCKKLNDWVTTNGNGYAQWKRTTAGGYSTGAGNINGDYPIHEFSDYTCVASPDGIALDYATSLEVMLSRHIDNATINLYVNDETGRSTGNNERIYIDENISLLQRDPNSNIQAYTCQTLPGTPRSWHFLSSSLSNSGIGFNYGTEEQVPFSWASNPCNVSFSSDNDNALFPSDMPDVAKIDLYAFYEPEYHWINLKRNTNSHWHMNATEVPITYTNETYLIPGKGYLVSIDQDQLLQNGGTLNNGNVSVNMSYTPAQEWAGLLGYNLIGNPYQSYLDFHAFAERNSALWYDDSKGGVEPTYAVYDASLGGYVQYKAGSSRGAKSASGTLNMHQGFMVRVHQANVTAQFDNTMRTSEGTGVSFREGQPAFPLINFTVTDDGGDNDFAVLELGHHEEAGAEKMRANDSKGFLYLRYGNDNYAILFRNEVETYQSLWFEASEAGIYTLTWETANAAFESLTLVDNITGTSTDMLSRDSYTFEATPDQYNSRFKIMIGDYKDIDDHEAAELASFAFVHDGTLVVNGTGRMDVIDMTGRVLKTEVLSDTQSRIAMSGLSSGIYLLRLTDNAGSKVQKIVLE